ncbi:Two-component response regulator, YesN/AraC family, consists of REC and AraC-type DNA-binding domains [Halolactibacillus halophilus]|uniref:Two-component response regulator, YesN/AraC family, consists of REC and AraC-type DNA-binding domains n=1 Tax=Halolactibacillus halophilus TaxID=306540 RepID=A0A1I5NPZ7_9BACI|nr:response regulator [Halolactibacillus halophilus]GEM01399.1 hypothetical protein HHA03_09310 [Halolactibacillus halophilus]SFP23301.1 Two-component response regulator, YesN/AraC family, consists of REC and AraC-type DNA-binding domains [Halolactibacillus halophilus]
MKILVVEDEPMIRQGIVAAIKQMDEHDVFGASNGQVALNIMDKEAPDILITDIRMPVMDGFELIQETCKNFPKTKMIILSGYQDFQYAQKAIQFGVKEYLTKPVGFPDLVRSLNKVTNQILGERTRQSFYKENKVLLQREWLRTIMQSQTDLTSFQLQTAKKLGIHFDGPFFRVVSVEFDQPVSRNEGDHLLQLIRGSYLSFFPSEYEIALVINESAVKIKETKEYFVSVLKYAIAKNYTITIGVSSVVDSSVKLAILYTEAVDARKQKVYFGENKVYVASDILYQDEQGHLPVISKEVNLTIIECLKNCDIARLEQKIDQLFQMFVKERYSLTKVHQWAVRILIRSYIELDREEELAQLDQAEIFALDNTVMKIQATLVQAFQHLLEKREAESTSTRFKLVNQTIDYIKEHYQEELALEVLAKQVFISPTYLSKIFKKEKGVSLITWLNDYRIEQAKITIKEQPAWPMYRVAAEVGFKDYKYFVRVFKKKTGDSPTEFRNRR